MSIEGQLIKLKERLLLPLPGKDAQFKFAPTYRAAMLESEIKQEAGVILLLYIKEGQLFFPLIKRSEYNGAHSGQISFPGGKSDFIDQNIVQTALRECHEEIGVNTEVIDVLGKLTELYIPVSKYNVHPFVGFLKKPVLFIPEQKEVVSIIEVPLSLILSPSIIDNKFISYKEKEESIPFFNIDNSMVWGATAMILSEFIDIWKEIA